MVAHGTGPTRCTSASRPDRLGLLRAASLRLSQLMSKMIPTCDAAELFLPIASEHHLQCW